MALSKKKKKFGPFLRLISWSSLGLGQALPKDVESAQASNFSSDARLRRHLLGRNHDKLKKLNGGNIQKTNLPAAKPRDCRKDRRACESSSEDEPGRSALGRRGLAKSQAKMSSEDETTDNLEDHTCPDDASNRSQQPNVGEGRAKAPDVGTKHYLDQVLAEKARRMRKRSKRKMRKEKMRKNGEAGETVRATR